jgi:hypothetical protein
MVESRRICPENDYLTCFWLSSYRGLRVYTGEFKIKTMDELCKLMLN